MPDRTHKEIVEHLWDKSDKRRGKRLALWVKDGNTRKERAQRAEAVELFAKQHQMSTSQRNEYRRWRMFRNTRVWMDKWAKRIRKGIRRRKRRHDHDAAGGLAGVDVVNANGEPHWGGGRDVMDQYVIPFLKRFGLWIGSRKRTPAYNASIGGSRTSSHLTTNTDGDAGDFGTYSGEDEARALANSIGWTSWQPNSYATFSKVIDGVTFVWQILWGSAIGHGDHIHVGIDH